MRNYEEYAIDWLCPVSSTLSFMLQTLLFVSSVVRYPRYLDTYRRYLRDDTSIANVTIYRGIS